MHFLLTADSSVSQHKGFYPNTQTVPGTSEMKPSNKQSSPIGAIEGSIMAVIAIVVIIVLIFMCRRRINTSRRNTKALEEPTNPDIHELDTFSAVDELHDQSSNGTAPEIYQSLLTIDHNQESDNDELDTYAAVDELQSSNGTGIYQSLTTIDPYQESVYAALDRQQDIPVETDPLYNVLGRLNENNEEHLHCTDNNELDNYAAMDEPQSSNGTGIYQSLLTIDPNQESVYTALDRQQDIPFDQSNPYDTVEHPVFKPPRKGPTDPLYNVLVRPNKNNEGHLATTKAT